MPAEPPLHIDDLLVGLEGAARAERAELIAWLLDSGFTLADVDGAGPPILLASRHLLGDDGSYVSTRQISEHYGIDLKLLQRMQRAIGLARVDDPDAVVHMRVDGEVAAHVQRLFALGLRPDDLVFVARVLAEGLAHTAEVMRYAVLAAIMQPGATELQLAQGIAALVGQVVPLLGPMIEDMLFMHLRHMLETEAVSASERAAGEPLPGARQITVGFADLVGFTRLGEVVPPEELGELANRLSDFARDLAAPPVRFVKAIGDAVMFVCTDPVLLLDVVLKLVAVLDAEEDAYDHACVLLALAHAHRSGNAVAKQLGEETFRFLDAHLEDARLTGFMETPDGEGIRRSNPHMHMLEAFLAWHEVTGDRVHLRRAARLIDLFRSSFFDPESWTLGEYFDHDWKPAPGEKGAWTEPGHHFEWASLLVDFAGKSGQKDLVPFARKLYASAVANGLNRATGLAYGAVSRQGLPLDRISRSWPQSEAIKAAIALDGTGGPDLKPEIEARVGRLFRWHIDPAPLGLWIDRIDERGRAVATEVPASIFYHLVCALTQYLDKTAEPSG